MGEVKNILAFDNTPHETMYNDLARAKNEECIALYWRNTRISMSKEQFEQYFAMLNKFKDSLSNEASLVDTTIGSSKVIDSITIEQNCNGVIHIHYMDVRIELEVSEFKQFAYLITEAALRL